MSLPSDTTDSAQDSVENLLETADRCRRLARDLTDRQTVERLLEMARECEERANVLKQGGDNGVRT
jgi:hypothetical protein